VMSDERCSSVKQERERVCLFTVCVCRAQAYGRLLVAPNASDTQHVGSLQRVMSGAEASRESVCDTVHVKGSSTQSFCCARCPWRLAGSVDSLGVVQTVS
jgi:hypothetical protein